MALEIDQQLKEALKNSRQILITFEPASKGDGAMAALALAKILKKMGKLVDVASTGYLAPASFNFLKEVNEIRPSLAPLHKLIIKVDINKNKLASLSYDVKDENLFIYITPQIGTLGNEQIKTASTNLKYDLIFVVDTPDLHALGKVYDDNTDLFTRVPLINIDHNPANEHFGKINIVDLSATACSEVVFEIAKKISPELLTPDVATLLLTGLILKTQSFRSPQINSRTLQNASRLVELGGEREKIVQNLYRRRTLPTLKLWGKTLSNLKNDAACGLVWTSLSKNDLHDSGTTARELPEVVDELIANSPEAKIIVLLYETETGVEGIITAQNNYDALRLIKIFNPEGTKARARIIIKDKDLLTAEKEVVEKIKEMLFF